LYQVFHAFILGAKFYQGFHGVSFSSAHGIPAAWSIKSQLIIWTWDNWNCLEG